MLLISMIALILSFAPGTPCGGVADVTFSHYAGRWDDLRAGYCMEDPSGRQWHIPGLVSWDTWQTPSPTHFTTRALYQSPGVIERSAAYHNVSLSDVFDGVSLMSPADVGRTLWVRHAGGRWYKARSGDAVAREHMWYHAFVVNSGIEFGYELAVELGAIGGGAWDIEVCVTDARPEFVCAGDPVDYGDWLRSIMRFE